MAKTTKKKAVTKALKQVAKKANKKAAPKKKTTAKKHPGFDATTRQIALERGISEEEAAAILASAARKSSPEAKAKNPRLKKVR